MCQDVLGSCTSCPACAASSVTRHANVAGRPQDEFAGAEGSVIAADFYRAGALLALPDEEIVARVLRNLQFCEPGFLGARARPPARPQPLHSTAGAPLCSATAGVDRQSASASRQRLCTVGSLVWMWLCGAGAGDDTAWCGVQPARRRRPSA